MSKLVRVEWLDIAASCDWRAVEDVNVISFESVGWLVENTDAQMKLANTKGPDGYGGIMAIPTGCVTRIEEL